MNHSISFSITGDSLTVRRLCKSSQPMNRIRDLLTASDVCFTNLETSLHRYEPNIYPSRFSGGDWVAASPEVLTDLNWIGFNLYGIPNNHSLDWTHNGLVRTIENLEKADVVFAGVGRNFAEACAPRYLETPEGTVALIACNSTFEPWHMAGEQRRDIHGRPGIFGIEFDRIAVVSEKEMEVLESLHAKMNRENDGWTEIDGTKLFRFGSYLYQIGTGEEITRVRKQSLAALKSSISEARRQADIVIVSIHSHERKADNPHVPADFQTELAHFCIDNGAHAFIAHGPHVLRGIEIYHGAPIIHGLGNFFYQCELLPKAPAEFYSKFSNFDEKACTADVYDYRVNNGGILGETNPDYFQTAIVQFSLENGVLENLTLYPVSLQFHAHRSSKGTPVMAEGAEADRILSQMEEMSGWYGTRFHRKKNCLQIILPENYK